MNEKRNKIIEQKPVINKRSKMTSIIHRDGKYRDIIAASVQNFDGDSF